MFSWLVVLTPVAPELTWTNRAQSTPPARPSDVRCEISVCVCAVCAYARSFSFITRRFRQPYLKEILPPYCLILSISFPQNDSTAAQLLTRLSELWLTTRRLNWGSRRKKKAKKRDYLFIKPHRFTFITSILLVAAILRFLKKKKRNYEEWAGNAVEISFVSMGSVL